MLSNATRLQKNVIYLYGRYISLTLHSCVQQLIDKTSARTIALMQAWNLYCHRTRNCGHQANIPKRAYLISMPKHQDKREHSVDLLEALGLEVEVIEGKEGDQVCCKPSNPVHAAASCPWECLVLVTSCLKGAVARCAGQIGSLRTHTRCLLAGIDVRCRAGLTLSHVQAWKALAASGDHSAWMFECATRPAAVSKNPVHNTHSQGVLT